VVTGEMARRAVFLDRDGTLNRAYTRADGVSVPPASVDQLELLPGVAEAVSRLRAAGLRLVVVTNQPDVARGTTDRQTVEQINAALRAQLDVDAVLCCYHDDADGCACRKPKPGMCLQAADEFDLDLSRSFLVGDSWRDIEAGQRAGCATVLVGQTHGNPPQTATDYVATDLGEAATIILRCLEEAHAALHR
jgi:D-glycero-D-manno-heptose 1,7-bisphosphate phosphatase